MPTQSVSRPYPLVHVLCHCNFVKIRNLCGRMCLGYGGVYRIWTEFSRRRQCARMPSRFDEAGKIRRPTREPRLGYRSGCVSPRGR